MDEERPMQRLDECWDRALCVVAHPDDIEFGPASLVARWTSQGKEVSYLLITRGEAGIDTVPPEQAAALREREQLNSYRPELLFTNSPHLSFGPGLLNSADHRAVGLAALDASHDAGNRWIFPELLEEGLEPWAGVRMICSGPPAHPTHAVDVTDYFHQGVASLREHAAYLEALGMHGDPSPFLRSFMEPAGARMGCELALAMDVIYGPGMPQQTPTGASRPHAD